MRRSRHAGAEEG
jgi:hypothetical protein